MLRALFQAIATTDRAGVSHLLADSPQLAREASRAGATRQTSAPYFLTPIARVVYAGDTALHIAAAAYWLDAAKELVAKGANPGARNRRGAEPLHYAADGIPGSAYWNPKAQAAMVAYLIGAGSDPDAPDKSGVTPLHRAVRTRSSAAVRVLLAHGADPRRRNGAGSTPLHLAVQNTGRGGSGAAEAKAEQAAIIRLLIESGGRWTDKDDRGRTVAACVSSAWAKELVRDLTPRQGAY
jgi:ankyrin repeat protein